MESSLEAHQSRQMPTCQCAKGVAPLPSASLSALSWANIVSSYLANLAKKTEVYFLAGFDVVSFYQLLMKVL